MPALSGNQKALMYSLAATLRAGAGRSGYFRPVFALSIGGTTVTSRTIKPTIRIVEELNEVPNTAELQVRGSSSLTPAAGQEVIIGFGNLTNRVFAGHIMTVSQAQPRRNQKKPTFSLDCIDYSWQLDWKRVEGKGYTGVGVGTIAADLLASFAPAFTVRAEAGLASVDFQSNHDERLSEALSRLVGLIGGFWYVDYDRSVRVRLTAESDGNAITLDSSNTGFFDFTYTEDLTDTRSRTRVTGGSSTVTTQAGAGSVQLAVDDTTLFGTSGGYALAGANQIAYTGKSVAAGAGYLTGIAASGAGSIAVDIGQGETVRVLAIADDATAATALVTRIGSGDGYLEHSLEDEQLGDAAARARASGDVTANKSVDKRITYRTRDISTRVGKTLSVDLTNSDTSQHISGSFQIQRVVITDIELTQTRNPIREVEAGNNRTDVFVALGAALES